MNLDCEPVGPSAIWNRRVKKECRELTVAEIEDIDFVIIYFLRRDRQKPCRTSC